MTKLDADVTESSAALANQETVSPSRDHEIKARLQSWQQRLESESSRIWNSKTMDDIRLRMMSVREAVASLPVTETFAKAEHGAQQAVQKVSKAIKRELNKSQLPPEFTDRSLPTPHRLHTARLLPPLAYPMPDTLHEPEVWAGLAGYRALYKLDQLPAYHHQGYLRAGDYRIHVQLFVPFEHTRGTVWLMHGYLEHSALYEPMIAELIAQDYAVITCDLPGHGLSSGEETGIGDFSVYQTMLMAIHDWVKANALPVLPKPWLGIGQSTGGAIWMDHVLRECARKQPPVIERMLLLSPLVRPAKSSWWHNPLGLSMIRQVKHRVPRKFRRNNSNPEFLRFVRLQDPLQPRAMSMSWIIALSRWMNYMEKLPSCRFPVWLVQGARDQTVDWRYNNSYVQRQFRTKVTLMLEDASHQLVNECEDIRAPLTALIPAFLRD